LALRFAPVKASGLAVQEIFGCPAAGGCPVTTARAAMTCRSSSRCSVSTLRTALPSQLQIRMVARQHRLKHVERLVGLCCRGQGAGQLSPITAGNGGQIQPGLPGGRP
jgi:hypothetical protein